jgi:serine/threonine-protein kinase
VDTYDPLLDTVVAGRYRIVRKLGEGGMSSVYEAKHIKLHRSFAIKVLLPQMLMSAEAQQRFQREAELLAGLTHPNVVEISDLDQLPDGSPCMVLEYLHGATLRHRLARGALTWESLARIGDQTMSALTLAHRTGITHRDLKPENIFLAIDDVGEERVKLLDFGVSKLRGVGATTGAFTMLGTPSYMSPEQASGQTELVGPPTDVWAMAAILYELAAGRAAFPYENLAQTLTLILTEAPAPVSHFRPDAPPAFVELLHRALSRDPERRIVEIDVLRSGLRAALDARNFHRPTPAAIVAPAPPPRLTAQVRSPSPAGTRAPPAAPPNGGAVPSMTPTNAAPRTTTHDVPSGTAVATRTPPPTRRLVWIGIIALLISGAAAILLAS